MNTMVWAVYDHIQHSKRESEHVFKGDEEKMESTDPTMNARDVSIRWIFRGQVQKMQEGGAGERKEKKQKRS